MSTAILILAASILMLAVVIALVARVAWNNTPPRTLTDEEIREHLAPCGAAELIVMQAERVDD